MIFEGITKGKIRSIGVAMTGETVIGQNRKNILGKRDKGCITKLLLRIESLLILPIASINCHPDKEENNVFFHGCNFIGSSQDQSLGDYTRK
jgi:hypothetical protein